MIAGDWNCKIGRLPSVAREKEYVRANTSDRTDSRGRRVMELMDASEMVILNGIRGSVALPTCKGRLYRGECRVSRKHIKRRVLGGDERHTT